MGHCTTDRTVETSRLPGVPVKRILAGAIDPAALWTGEQDADCHRENMTPRGANIQGVGANSLLASGLPLSSVWSSVMLDDAFRKQRARPVCDLAEKADVPFIKGRLLDLAIRYEDGGPKTPTPLTPVDLQLASRSTGPER